jgi:hypothetical protein
MTIIKATDLSIEMFGGVIYADSAGSFPGLELFNFLLECEEGILPSAEDITITRYAHNFARRLVHDETLSQVDKDNVLADKHSENSIRKLLSCLELQQKNGSKNATWQGSHFFPYTKSLIHWDANARFRGQTTAKITMERQYYRGAGAYVFNVLRFDPNQDRLQTIREGVSELFGNEKDSPLENLAKTLRNHGDYDKSPVTDETESKSRKVFNDELEDLYRDGVFNILSHKSIPAVSKIKAIVNWTGIWLIIVGNKRSKPVDSQPAYFIIDCAGTNQQLRRASQKSLKDFIKQIADGIAYYRAGREMNSTQIQKLKGFFASTAASMKLINALTGKRHFTFGLNSIETLTLVAVKSGDEIPFEDFVHNWLYKKCSFVIGRISANDAGFLNILDASIFEENERKLADQVRAVGMLKVYSDATKMVGLGSEK